MRRYAVLFAILFVANNLFLELSAQPRPAKTTHLENLKQLLSRADEEAKHVKAVAQYVKDVAVTAVKYVREGIKEVGADSSLYQLFGNKVLLWIQLLTAKAQFLAVVAKRIAKRLAVE